MFRLYVEELHIITKQRKAQQKRTTRVYPLNVVRLSATDHSDWSTDDVVAKKTKKITQRKCTSGWYIRGLFLACVDAAIVVQ